MGLDSAMVRAGRRFLTAISGSAYKHIGSKTQEDREPQMTWAISDVEGKGYEFTGYVTSNAGYSNTINIARELNIQIQDLQFNYIGSHQWGVFKKKGSKGKYKEEAMLPGGDKTESKTKVSSHEPKKTKPTAPKKKVDRKDHAKGTDKKPKRTERAIHQDKHIKAMKPGKHTSEDGGIYYEYRDNHTDQDRRKKFSKGGRLTTASKEYQFFVVNENKKIVAGFEYREDAKDFTKEVDAAAGMKIYTASWIKINLKYDPYDYENWSNLFKSGGTVSDLYGEDLKKKFFHK
jgi:hypothetical protein